MSVGGIGGRIPEFVNDAAEAVEEALSRGIGGVNLADAREATAGVRRFLHELRLSARDLREDGALEKTARSFLKPTPEFPVAAPPRAGDAAPLLPPGVRGPAVLKMFRHPGCPFAEEDKNNLLRAARERPDLTFVAVVHGDPEVARAWFGAARDLPNVRLVTDPSCEYYSKWGNGPTSTGYFAGPEGLVSTVKQMAKPPGYRLDTLTGNRHWPGATASIDANGRVAGFWPEAKMGKWVDIGVAERAAAGGA